MRVLSIVVILTSATVAVAGPEPMSREAHEDAWLHRSAPTPGTAVDVLGPRASPDDRLDGYVANVSIDPVGAVTGAFRGSIAFGLTNQIAFRLDGQAVLHDTEMGSWSSHGWSAGASVPVYVGGRLYDGFFLEPGVLFRRIDDDRAPFMTSVGRRERAFTGASLAIGYSWMESHRLTIAASVGVARDANFLEGTSETAPRDGWIGLASLRFGWAFLYVAPRPPR